MGADRRVAMLVVVAVSLAVGTAPAVAVRPVIPRAVSCPSVSLCVAVDDSGNVVTSTDPTGGAATWRAARIDNGLPLSGVSCGSADLCVVHDQSDNLLASTAPTSSAQAWKKIELEDGPSALSCPSVSLCVGVNDSDVLTSTNPAGGAAAWTSTRLPGHHSLLTVSCASTQLCVAPDIDVMLTGAVLTSTDPTAGAGAWTRTAVGPRAAWVTVSCVSGAGTLCMALDALGLAATTTSPSAAAGTWTAASGGPHGRLRRVVCPSVTLCVAELDDEIWTTTTPTHSTGSWHAITLDRGGDGLVDLSCPSAALCVAIDANGSAFTSTDPTGDTSAWIRAAFDHRTRVISQADIRLDLGATLDELNQNVPRVAKVRTRGYELSFDDLDTGVLKVGWYAGQTTLVATGRTRVPDTGAATVRVRLTAAGRTRVAAAHGRPIALRAKATLTRATGKPIASAEPFALR